MPILSLPNFQLPTLSSPRWNFWLGLTLAFAIIYSLIVLQKAFAVAGLIHDDVRQHVFWMWRYVDPELFPRDAIADYFQSIAPVGYSYLYRLGTVLHIDPVTFSKLLPPILALITTWYSFFLCREIFPLPSACFITALLCNQTLWMKDDVISATSRAFVYPLFLAFLYYLVKRALIPCIVALIALGVFYPLCLLICGEMLTLQLLEWHRGLHFSRNSQDYYVVFVCMATIFIILLPYALSSSEFGPTISRAQAIQLPEFYPQGRVSFFKDNFWYYLLDGGRGGMIHESLLTPVTLVLGLFLPLITRFPDKFPLVKQIKPSINLLWQLILVSVILFALAHGFLFTLYLPSRYTQHTFGIVLVFAAGITIAIILNTLLHYISSKTTGRNNKLLAGILAVAIAFPLIFYPSLVADFPSTKYQQGKATALYQFLQQQPKDIVIASLASEASYLPTFAQRSILVSREHAIPYHVGYYNIIRQRIRDLMVAQYSSDLKTLKQLIHRHNIDFFLLENGTFQIEYLQNNSWLKQYKITQAQIASLKQGNVPTLAAFQDSCSVFADQRFNLIAAECILNNK